MPRLTLSPQTNPHVQPTRAVCMLARMLSVTTHTLNRTTNRPHRSLDVTPGQLTVITGHSGSGKTTALSQLTSQLRSKSHSIHTAPLPNDPLPNLPVIDIVRKAHKLSTDERAIERAAELCASTGLSDAHVLAARPAFISTGERARVHLACTLSKAIQRPMPVLVVDEFAATLDRATALGLARAIRKWTTQNNAITLIATNRSEVLPTLDPDQSINLDATSTSSQAAPTAPRFTISQGSIDHYTKLSHDHYRMKPPANPARILVATNDESGDLAGVLVTAYPTINGSWRALAWPGRYNTPDKRTNARRINSELRCIARVVIPPAYRSLGVARTLVQHYLKQPDTHCTESVAAMGRFNPFLERAGMTAYRLPLPKRTARLFDAIQHASIDDWRLTTPTTLAARISQHPMQAHIERELRIWASTYTTTKHIAQQPLTTVIDAVASSADTTQRTAYAATHH